MKRSTIEVTAYVITGIVAAALIHELLMYKRTVYKERIATTGGRTLNNPGNIEKRKLLPGGGYSRNLFVGEVTDGGDARFTSFVDMKTGYRAIARILKTKHSRGLKTLAAMIMDYAPEADNNNTADYIEYVSTFAGVDPNKDMMEYMVSKWVEVIKAIGVFEQGRDWLDLHGANQTEWATAGYSMA